MIKACGQDADVLTDQVSHIVSQLCYPTTFAEIVLLIDPHKGKFLRQYASADLTNVINQAKLLKAKGLINRVLIAPTNENQIIASYINWFGVSNCVNTHTCKNAPLFSQIWGFDQVKTRYVLQSDLDVLIGRRDWQHNYILDMLEACQENNVLAVGFNISKRQEHFEDYYGDPGQFAPEVRLGLLDLHKIAKVLPIKNPISNNRLTLTWHRALQYAMQQHELKAVRGGHPDTFYMHPRNEHKHLPELLSARDMVAQGKEPLAQREEFDWVPGEHWRYSARNEEVVFLLKGKNTRHSILKRCLDSLRAQTNQNFGVILIDDGGRPSHNWCYPMLLGELQRKTTLVRHPEHKGRIPNFLLAIKEICLNPETLIAILDQDDCLMRDDVVSRLYEEKQKGADLIQMPMFRPNKPLKLYQPIYDNPRQAGGANVWSHFRVFSKRLFESVPVSYFKPHNQSEWIERVTDYSTMIPMVELAKYPIYIDMGYVYWHERPDYSSIDKKREQSLIKEVLSKPTLVRFDNKPVEQ